MSVMVTRHQNFVGGDWVDAYEGETQEGRRPGEEAAQAGHARTLRAGRRRSPHL